MANLSRYRRPVKPKPPLAARFLGGADDEGRRLLLIRKDGRDHTYLVTPIVGDEGECGPELLGFRVEQPGKTDVYDVDLAANSCDCLAGLYHGHCLHREGLLLAARSAPEAVGHHGTADGPCPF